MTDRATSDPHDAPPSNPTGAESLDAVRRDLFAEQGELDDLVSAIPPSAFYRATPSPGWNVFDQIAHLTYFDDRAALALADPERFTASVGEITAHVAELDDFTLSQLRTLAPATLLARWRDARAELTAHGANLDTTRRVAWYGPSMSATNFLRARLMETWAHGHDVATALETRRPPTSRLVHVATLGYLTRAWSYRVRGEPVPEGAVAVELEGPHDNAWRFGPTQVDDVVSGDAEEFCLVVTQRRHVDDTQLRCGELARDWLLKAQAFAGGPSNGPRATA